MGLRHVCGCSFGNMQKLLKGEFQQSCSGRSPQLQAFLLLALLFSFSDCPLLVCDSPSAFPATQRIITLQAWTDHMGTTRRLRLSLTHPVQITHDLWCTISKIPTSWVLESRHSHHPLLEWQPPRSLVSAVLCLDRSQPARHSQHKYAVSIEVMA